MSLLAATLLLAAASSPTVSAANSAEQIVFSGTGSGNLGPFGFWIWCEDAEANNPYAGRCNGAMYFYNLGVTKSVIGTVTELQEGQYAMNVASRDASVTCTLVNSLPVQRGPRNTVTATCTVNSQGFSGTSTTAVVNVTGP
jgi:hypothetical protein